MIYQIIYHLTNFLRWDITKKVRGKYYSHLLSFAGSDLRIAENVVIFNPKMVSIGDNCYLGTGVQLYAWNERIIIGNNVLIAAGVKMITRKHKFTSMDVPISNQGYTNAPILIGDNVWIGFQVIILPGVKIGENSIIGAGAVITHDVERNTIVAGVPARPIQRRTPESVIK